MNSENIAFIEDKIQYSFNNKVLLKQAFLFNAKDTDDMLTNDALISVGRRSISFIVQSIIDELCGKRFANRPYIRSKKTSELENVAQCLDNEDIYAIAISVLNIMQFVASNQQGDIADIDIKLFYAIVGAAVIDSNFDIKKVSSLVKFVLNVKYFVEAGESAIDLDPVIKVYNYSAEHGLPIGEFEFTYENGNVICGLTLPEIDQQFVGTGSDRTLARFMASLYAVKYLEDNKLIKNIVRDAGQFNVDNAVDTLDSLAIAGYFSMPDYYTVENEGVFSAKVSIDGAENFFEASANDKKLARAKAAYKMLCYLVGRSVPEDNEI